ncbi:MAG: tetratricopeptide repeat protein, partial [Nitrospira sp.]|nr:tetratricopeptide repeat protein [Nitrospira sp.]
MKLTWGKVVFGYLAIFLVLIGSPFFTCQSFGFSESLTLKEVEGIKQADLLDLLKQGGALYDEGNLEEALTKWESGHVRAYLLGEKAFLHAFSLNIGVVHLDLGEYTKAKLDFEEALTIAKDLGDLKKEGSVYINLGLWGSQLGQHEVAKKYLSRAKIIYEYLNYLPGLAKVLGNLGIVAEGLEQDQEALAYHQESLTINQKLENRIGEAKDLGNLGNVATHLRQYSQAQEFFSEALRIGRELGDRDIEALALQNLGLLAIKLNKYDEALIDLKTALVTIAQVENLEIKWRVFYGLQTAYSKKSELSIAAFWGKQAVFVLQFLRGHVFPLGTSIERSYVQQRWFVYEEVADLLIDMGRLWEAQQ